MTKEEELRQLEELRRIQEEDKINMDNYNYLEDSAFTDSSIKKGTSSDKHDTDSAFSDSAFSGEFNQQAIQNPIQNHIQNPMNNVMQPMQQYQQPVQQQYQQPVQQYQQPVQQYQQPVQQQRPIQHQEQQQQQRPQMQQRPQQQRSKQHQKTYQQQVLQQQQKPQHAQKSNLQPAQSKKGQANNINYNKIDNQSIDNNSKKKRKKKHPLLKTLIILLIIILGIGGLGIGLAVKALNKMERVETDISKRPDNFKGDVYNILLIGQDAREGQGIQRADTIILCTINKSTHTVTLTSIMRDTYVNIPGYGGNRINAAFAFGGIDLLDQTIEENFGVKIDGNALVDFGGFMDAMASVGNLDIELTAEEAEYLNQHPELGTTDEVAVETWNLHEGVNTLTPGQVLGYSRIRHVGNSDWDRTNRQRTVIMAVIDKIKHGHLIKGFKVLDGVAPHITTDISTKNILKSAFSYVRCSGGGMQSYYLPAEGTYQATYVDGMAVLVPDIEANKQVLQQYMQGIDPSAQ
ncbi:MAG: LCP family protein [Lachnospiraceae bacterium]|nr:LCP family protein [Lachnospiraceae bacterium]